VGGTCPYGDRICNYSGVSGGSPGSTYDDTPPLEHRPGSGGGGEGTTDGFGGWGGAAIHLSVNEMILNGSILVNGSNGGRGGGGGGSGGGIKIDACILTTSSSASLQAKGGNGGSGCKYLGMF